MFPCNMHRQRPFRQRLRSIFHQVQQPLLTFHKAGRDLLTNPFRCILVHLKTAPGLFCLTETGPPFSSPWQVSGELRFVCPNKNPSQLERIRFSCSLSFCTSSSAFSKRYRLISSTVHFTDRNSF